MQLPDSFVNEMNDFFTRHNEVPRDGFYESFDKVPLKGVRFSRSKISCSAQEKEFLYGAVAVTMLTTNQAEEILSITQVSTILRSLLQCCPHR